MKIVIVAFLVLCLIAMLFVVSALMLSSRLSQGEGIEQSFPQDEVPEQPFSPPFL